MVRGRHAMAVRSFLASHPGVKIDLKLDDGFIDLIDQGIDVAVRIGDLVDSGLIARRIGTAERALVASRKYLRTLPKGVGLPRSPADLARHNCIVYTELAARGDWTFVAGSGASAAVGTVATMRVTGNLQTNSSEVIRAAVLAGMGISYSPTWLFREELASGELQILLPDWPMRPLPLHLVSPAQRRHSAKVKAFGEHVAGALAMEQT